MPRYDFECPECDIVSERFCHVEERNNQTCSECGGPMLKYVSRLTVVGPTPTKPLDYTKQLGRTFETTAQRDAFFAEHHCVEKSKSDSSVTKLRDQLRETRETRAVKAGYKSLEHMQAERKSKRKKEATTSG
jgi:putative FmdB family regulatory protein